MSNFLTNHPKLTIAFNGAVQNYQENLKVVSIGIGAGSGFSLGMGLLLAGTAALLPTAIATALSVAIVGALGGGLGMRRALKELKAEKRGNKRTAEFQNQSPETLRAANERTTAAVAREAREDLRYTKQTLKNMLRHRAPRVGA